MILDLFAESGRVVDWKTVRHDFEFDGSWRDLYVLNTDLETWQKLLELFRAGAYPSHYTVDGIGAELPGNIETVFDQKETACPSLSVDVYGIRVNCHFFLKQQIEFDIDPREITDAVKFDSLCRFMRWVGQGLGRDVILTPEGGEQEVILRYAPKRDELEYGLAGTLKRAWHAKPLHSLDNEL